MSTIDYYGNNMPKGGWWSFVFFIFVVIMILLQIFYGKA